MGPIMNKVFFLEGIEYYREGSRYYADNGVIRESIPKKQWDRAVFAFYAKM